MNKLDIIFDKTKRQNNKIPCDLCKKEFLVPDLKLIYNKNGESYPFTIKNSREKRTVLIDYLIVCDKCVSKDMPKGWKVKKI